MSSSTAIGQDGSGVGQIDWSNVNLTALNAADPAAIYCFIQASTNGYDGGLGVRIPALFVILIVSSAVTFFPVIATRSKCIRIPLYVYLFARYFGAGVIVATAFVHLLDPAYAEIGPDTCVGQQAGWVQYSWPPAIALFSCMMVFLMDFGAERYVEEKYGFMHGESPNAQDLIEDRKNSVDAGALRYTDDRRHASHHNHQALHSGDQDNTIMQQALAADNGGRDLEAGKAALGSSSSSIDQKKADAEERSFQEQIAAFLILEFGVIFHSVIIGLTLGSAGPEFAVLYPVIVFHQSFEGLGIGARMSAIPFPKRLSWLPWALCAGYGLTTPIAIAAGLGVRTTYNSGSFTANVVSGVLDSISAGILIYTGLVELLARDFLFNPDRTRDNRQLTFMIISVLLGAGVMALLGKWA